MNLSLAVLGRRPDGFHELRTLFQAVDLADEVVVSRSGSGIQLEVDGPDLGPVRENLAYRAAVAFLELRGKRVDVEPGVRIELVKRIPAGAGLGGGSSDAAAVLRALSAFEPDPPPAYQLAELAAKLGSDVPFFLGTSPFAEGRGRGEILHALPPLPSASLVLVLPPVHVATAEAYGLLARSRASSGPADPIEPASTLETEAPGVSSRAGAPSTWEDMLGRLRNDFEPLIAAAHPEIRKSLDALRAEGADGVLMSGSGAASFGVFLDGGEAVEAARVVRERLGWRVEVARTLTEMPRVGRSPATR